MIGLEGLRHNVRQGVERGKYFEELMRSDPRFQILFPVTLGLICFQLKSPNSSVQVSYISYYMYHIVVHFILAGLRTGKFSPWRYN